ncbi:hypothetical protein M0R45_024991 [Rubus argutus]|uniref:Pectinesterase inhibitor domain-containing protein n=1 Tax=Rubus argutus TaxID=59490 RepID=A0AAW1WWY9_RUBAR
MRCLFVVTFLVLFHSTMGDDLIQQSCKKAKTTDKSLNYNFCVSTLEASPKSRGANLAGLTAIVLDLAGAKVTSINSLIAKLSKDPKVDQPALQDCDEVYSDAIDSVQEAKNAFKSQSYDSALEYLSALLNAPDTCETGFQERKAVSPLKKEDDDMTQLGEISLAFIAQLRGGTEHLFLHPLRS